MSALGFLDLIRRNGSAQNTGDEFGGAAGSHGQGLPTSDPGNFMFATGIECSYPTIEHGRVRRDQLAECGHYDRWKADLGLVHDLGLKVLRYGLPYYAINTSAGVYDWDFADNVMREMQRLGITPILDLMHFGVPEWLGNFQNPELPGHFADYAEAVATRYPWVRYYTPINEIYVTARMSAKDGLWNEQLKTDRAFVTAMKHLVAASIMATHRLAKLRPNAVIVTSESAEYAHDAHSEPTREIILRNKQRFVALDLLYGHDMDVDMCMYMMDNGLTRDEHHWFMRGEPPGYQVMGIDYYGRNESIVLPDGTSIVADDVTGWYLITKEYYNRYRKPVMYTETNVFEAEKAPTWLWKQWINVLRMRADNVPV
ncbi:family 1 glycosylhydrolase, partial [Gemmatimonas sp.]|uniref:family 1 glycosylhydrolase n=1 Tax=Gemmatimonas sp. TaxID=1962908 RepID=UPI00356775FB